MGIAPAHGRDVARAVAELALARLRLARLSARDIHALGEGALRPLDARGAMLATRVAHIMPRVAARLPWRADCLVQALAARHWLEREGVATRLELGARAGGGEGFAAHAWLRVEGRIVVGGDVSGYGRFGALPATEGER